MSTARIPSVLVISMVTQLTCSYFVLDFLRLILLNHIKTTFKHHENDPEKRLYQDVVNSLTEYKKLQREAKLNKSMRSGQTGTLNRKK